MSTFASLFLLWIIDWAGNTQMTEESSSVFSWLSLLRHYEPLSQGNVNSSDIAYYLILITVFLLLTIRHLDSQRLT